MNYWDKIAENKGYYFGDDTNPARLLALKLVKDGESFLDVGCGNGMMYELLKNRKIEYLGLDYSTEMVMNCRDRFDFPCFRVEDVRNLKDWKENSYDTVYMRHCLENIKDWQSAIKDMFKIANKRVIIDMRRDLINEPSRLLEDHDDTVCWDINFDELNILCRTLSVNVSYIQQPVGDSNTIIVIGKHMDDVFVSLDDFHETNHNLPILLDLKYRFPDFKATLFTIPSKCSEKWLKDIKKTYPWLELAVHGYYHDNSDGQAYECDSWQKSDARLRLKATEQMGVFIKGFKAPGWNINRETYEVLAERGYWIMEHKDHDTYPDIKLPRLTTGHLWEVNGHIQNVNLNGLEELSTIKCNFGTNTKFHFASECVDDNNYLYKLI